MSSMQSSKASDETEIEVACPEPTLQNSAKPLQITSDKNESFAKYLKRALILYIKQWAKGVRLRIFLISHLVFWMSLLPSLVLGSWIEKETEGEMGISEVLFSTILGGLISVLLSSQALAIVGVSGSSAVFTIAISQTAKHLALDFLPWMACIGLWAALLLFLLSLTNACKLVVHLTSFSWEILRVFVALTFLWNGVEEIIHFFGPNHSLGSSLLSLWLATCTFVLAVALKASKCLDCITGQARDMLQSYGPVLGFLFFTALPMLPKLTRAQYERVNMPDFFHRTDNLNKLIYLARFRTLPVWAVFLAFIPGVLLAAMIFIDHNGASLLLQNAGNRDPAAEEHLNQSWQLFVVAWMICLCSLLGLPFCYCISEQSIAHKLGLLSTITQGCDEENQRKSNKAVVEQRVSGFVVYILLGIPLLPGIMLLLEKVPKGVLAGISLQIGISCLEEVKLITRIHMWHGEGYTTDYRFYSAIQLSCVGITFAVSKTPATLLFPLSLLFAIWICHYLMREFFFKPELCDVNSRLCKVLGDYGEKGVCGNENVGCGRMFTTTEQIKGFESSSSSCKSSASPSILEIPSNRRLKERSARRCKRKRQACVEFVDKAEDEVQHPTRPKQRALSLDNVVCQSPLQQNSTSPWSDNWGASYLKLKMMNKKKVAFSNPIELHSNLLYDVEGKDCKAKTQCTGSLAEFADDMLEEPAPSCSPNLLVPLASVEEIFESDTGESQKHK